MCLIRITLLLTLLLLLQTTTGCCDGSDERCRMIPREETCERRNECFWSCDQTSPPKTSPPITSPPKTSPPVASPPVTAPPVTSPPGTPPPATSPPDPVPPVEPPECCYGDSRCDNIRRKAVCDKKPQCDWNCDSTTGPPAPNQPPSEHPSMPPNESPVEPPTEAPTENPNPLRICAANWDPVCISDSTQMINAGNECDAMVAQSDDPSVTVECECGCPCDEPCPIKEILNCCINTDTDNPCGVSGKERCLDNAENGCVWLESSCDATSDSSARDIFEQRRGGGHHLDLLIIGGSDFAIDTVMWMGSLAYTTTQSHNCGLSLISKRWGVTAAHCIPLSPGSYTGLFANALRSKQTTSSVVSQKFRHPSYDGSVTSPADIALIEFQSDINLEIATLRSSSVGTDETLSIIGWGRTCGLCSLPDPLQTATVASLSAADCVGYYSNAKSNHVCLLHSARTQGACNGDSGGPAIDSENRVVGVTSFGTSGCTTDRPSVYTRISSYCDWIQAVSGVSCV